MEPVSTTAFGKALAALERAQVAFEEHLADEFTVMARNSVILEFEICFGQVLPMLQRSLIELSGLSPAQVKDMSFATVIRNANVRGYTSVEWGRWHNLRDFRNRTAHAYSEEQAIMIAAAIPEFLAAAQEIRNNVQRKQEMDARGE